MPARGSITIAAVLVLIGTGCAHRRVSVADEHASHAVTTTVQSPAPGGSAAEDSSIPAGATTVEARLAASPRHGEYVMVAVPGGDSVRAWVVYPERRDKAPVVVVIHEIYGLTPWVRGVADQLAADGFIAIAPDLLTGQLGPGGIESVPADSAVAATRRLNPRQTLARIDATAQYALALPAALPKYGVIGFCWGGSMSFAYATRAPQLAAAVPYYGDAMPDQLNLANIKAPVLAQYGEDDARVNASIPAADSVLRRAGVSFRPMIHQGAGHGFLRQQDGRNGANLAASRAAWPATIAFLREQLGG